MLGLTLSLRLAQRGSRVTLLEASDRVGGLADAWELGDVTWDRHYHVTLMSDSRLRAILAELQLDDQMRWSRTRTGFLVDGQLTSMSGLADFLRFPPLRFIDKLRLGWTIWQASRRDDWQTLEKIPVADWLIKHGGRRTFNQIWLPLLKAKLGDAWQRTSAAFIWATIQRMYAARRTGLKYEMFGYLPGGYARLLSAFQAHLQTLGVDVCVNHPVRRIERDDDGGYAVTGADGEVSTFDRVVVTLPAPTAARVCPQLSEDEIARLADVEYLGIICASVLMKKPLAGYYVTNITDAAPFTGVIEMTALVDPAELGGRTLVYLPKYLTADDAAWSKSDDEVRVEFIAALERLFPNFDADDVLAFRVSRVRNVFALSTLNYSRRVPPIETSSPGLFIVTSAQIVNGTLNVNETIRQAESSLDTLCQPLPHPLPAFGHDAPADRELIARPR